MRKSFFVAVLLAASASASHASVIDFGVGLLNSLNHAPPPTADIGSGFGSDLGASDGFVEFESETGTKAGSGPVIDVGEIGPDSNCCTQIAVETHIDAGNPPAGDTGNLPAGDTPPSQIPEPNSPTLLLSSLAMLAWTY